MPGRLIALVLLASVWFSVHCEKAPREPDSGALSDSSPGSEGKGPRALPSQQSVVAFGDVHGDLAATRKVLRLLGAIDDKDRWVGGALRVVQTGDQLDRGDDEQAILDLFDRLRKEAKAAGGAFIALNGNHEVMNVAGDFRYVTHGGWGDFHGVPGLPPKTPDLDEHPPYHHPRMLAFRPGGPYARILARQPVIAVVEDTLFVHGSLLPKHAEYGIDKINQETQAWMRGERDTMPEYLGVADGPVWSRLFSYETDNATCQVLAQVLHKTGAKRMVVGHTPYVDGINSACDGKVWRIDTGMAQYYRGVVQALEIHKGKVRIFKAQD